MLSSIVLIVWAAFWVYWLIAAQGAKAGSHRRRTARPSVLLAVAFVLLRVLDPGGLAVQSPVVQAVGVIALLTGLGLAVWARIHLGRNWGMPMTEKDEPELVVTGPYRYVRHPIYSGILLAILGTALATNLYWLIAAALLGIYFVYSASVEERLLTASLASQYKCYQAKTKMLIPFVL
ncbi:MAG TPA: isoprenylcysteine carboxylmethyltransferase family protein [Solirubrobacteraceae bacterium]|jgi:protein-S-isoprenylcysteine O-methyltransferase Ste14